jgi:hypothetical protein
MPSRKGLVLRLLGAAIAGGVIVVGVVLPAEYNIDPTGFGKITGLTALAAPPAPAPQPNTAPGPEGQSSAEPPLPKNVWFYSAQYRSDTVQIPLGPDGELEYKIQMKPGGVIVYNWAVDTGSVYYDFHGERPEDPKNAERYREVQEATHADGAFVAPFEGIHGWYWLNLTGKPLVITLKLSGFYELKPGILK